LEKSTPVIKILASWTYDVTNEPEAMRIV